MPRIAHGIIDLVATVLSPSTRRVLKIYGYDKNEWQTDILKRFDQDQLPVSLGGNL